MLKKCFSGRLRAGFGKLRGRLHFVGHALVNGTQLCRGSDLLVHQVLVVNADRIILLPALDLLRLAVALRVAHRVAAETVSDDLHKIRPAARTNTPQGLFGRLAHFQHVHAIHAPIWHAVTFGFLADLRDRRGAFDRRAHAVLVIFAHPQHGQLPDFGQVERLVEVADVRRPVPKHADGDAVCALVQVAQGQARGKRQVGAHNGMPAPEILAHVRHVHRAAPALRAAGRFAKQLGDHLVGAQAAVDRHAVIAVSRDDAVLRLAGRDQAGADRLLADIQVQKTANLALLVKLGGLLFELADQHHLVIQS